MIVIITGLIGTVKDPVMGRERVIERDGKHFVVRRASGRVVRELSSREYTWWLVVDYTCRVLMLIDLCVVAAFVVILCRRVSGKRGRRACSLDETGSQ